MPRYFIIIMKSTSVSFTTEAYRIVKDRRVKLGKDSPKGSVTWSNAVNSIIEECGN